MSWFKNPLDFAEGLLDQVDKRVSSVVGPSSQDGDSEGVTGTTVRPGPLKSAWDDPETTVIEKATPQRLTPTTSPLKSPPRSRSGAGSTVKLPPRKLPPRNTPVAATTSSTSPAASTGGDTEAAEASGRQSQAAVGAKPATTPTKRDDATASPLRHPPPRASPQISSDRSLPAATAAADLASSPPAALKSSTTTLPVKSTKVEPIAQQSSSPGAQLDINASSAEGAGWLAVVPKHPAADTSPKSASSTPSEAARQPAPDTSTALPQLPRPPAALASKSPAASPVSRQAASSSQAAEPAAAALAQTVGAQETPATAGSGDEPAAAAGWIGNGVEAVHHQVAQEPAANLAAESAHQGSGVTSSGSSGRQDSPQADVTEVPLGDADTEKMRSRLDNETSARRKLESEVNRVREELTAAQGRAAVAEAGLAEARDHLATLEDRAAAAEHAASHADGAAADAQQSAQDAAATAAAAAAASDARAAAAADATAAARSKAREAMERADLKADALRSCEARLGVVETELEEASTARDAAVAEATKLRAEVATAAERAVTQGNEAVDSLQKDLNAAQEAAAAAQAEAAAERASASEARVTAERRLEAMEGALGVAHAEASHSTRAAEEAVEALEAAEATNASLQQRLAEMSEGTSGARENPAIQEVQSQLEAAEARCHELDCSARQAHHRIEELEQELAEQRTGTARHAMQELQGQLKQANQLLAERQAMWEGTAAEHAARSLTLERQLAQLQDKLLTAGRQPHTGGDRRSATLSVAGEDVIPMDSLHGYYRFVSHRRFGKAFKAIGGTVDSVTAQVVAVLRRNPLARVAVLLYVLFVHLLIYVLLGRMQHHAAVSAAAHAPPGMDVTGTLSRFDTPINKVQNRQ